MPRKKKAAPKEVKVEPVARTVNDLIPISELLKAETTILGERSTGKLPRDAEFSPHFLETATRLVAAGLTEKDLAYVLGTTHARIKMWKRKNPLFKQACTNGRQVAKTYLIARGLKAAAGYNTDEVNYKIKRKVLDDGTVVEYAAEESHFHKHVKPDSTLLVFMLANISRQLKDEVPWQSQHRIDVSEDKKVTINISGKVASEQIDRLAGAFNPASIIDAEIVDVKDTDKKSGHPRVLPAGDTETHTK